MATKNFDTLKWLQEDLGFTPDEAKALSPQFDKRKDKLSEGYLRQADYSKSMNDLKTLQGQLAAKDHQLNNEMAEWAKLQGEDENKAAKLRTELDTTKVEKYQLEQKIKTLAEEHGIDIAQVLPKEPTVPEPPKAPAFDETRFVPREQFGSVIDYMLGVPAELQAIAQEHFDLTGERLDTRPLIADLKALVAKKQPADLRQIWETKYQVGEKRTEKSKADHAAEIAAAEARGREAARSEAQLPGQHPTGVHAPIFTQTGESKVSRPQPGNTTRGFADSLRSRKYAPGPGGGSTAPGAGGSK
jgi:hypothetical protein